MARRGRCRNGRLRAADDDNGVPSEYSDKAHGRSASVPSLKHRRTRLRSSSRRSAESRLGRPASRATAAPARKRKVLKDEFQRIDEKFGGQIHERKETGKKRKPGGILAVVVDPFLPQLAPGCQMTHEVRGERGALRRSRYTCRPLPA